MQKLTPLSRVSSDAFIASIPGSKSYTNRALILASQRMGTTRVANALFSEDTELLAKALSKFQGLQVEKTDDGFVVTRSCERLGAPSEEVFMGGAGTPARFLLSFASTVEGETVVTGIPRLCERPMVDLLNSLSAIGIRYDSLGTPEHLPVRIHGGSIEAREWKVHGGVSSQYTSSLCLLAAQQPSGPIQIHIEGDQVSRPYVNMTLSMMNACGIGAKRDGHDAVVVTPSRPMTDTIPVEVDASGMSYFLAAAAITGTKVEIPGISEHSAQGDVGLAGAFQRMGCNLEVGSNAIRITGARLRGIDIDMDTMPDVVLTLAVVAALADGPTRIDNIANLRLKECDRINAAARELERLGVTVDEGRDYLVIHPNGSLRSAQIHTYDDHRVAMAFAVLGLVSDGIEIEDPTCVAKSFPNFWNEFNRFHTHHDGQKP
jgi:3-phosphoshikimate 1-carboxyvinyltransferase